MGVRIPPGLPNIFNFPFKGIMVGMKKVKLKNKTRMAEGELRIPEKSQGEESNSLTPKAKEKEVPKKNRLIEKTQGGFLSTWSGKVQWIGKIKEFFREVKIELRKVTWPSRKETMAATAMVIILSVLVSFFLGLLDVGLAKLISGILKR
jgi:preprotein translocase subunit SecE